MFSTKSFKSLGTLSCHSKSCQALAFAHPHVPSEIQDASDNDDGELTTEEKALRSRWLVSGAQDHRLAIWQLISFSSIRQ